MDKYENIAVVGEGSYGLVMKCRHKETGQIVAIKKFMETEDDFTVRKMALREIRMLKKLRHENLVNLIDVFRRKRRFYLVFEFMDHTVLDELQENTNGLGDEVCRQHIFQIIRGIDFCHTNNIIHRDVKPENVLVSRLGVVKLCDFGFARLLAAPGESYTDYVATRWYRAPELLVGDTKYGREVDIWAVGCLFAEMMCGDPLFPGDSDIDQLYQIVKVLGKLSQKHQHMVARNPMFKGLRRSAEEGHRSVVRLFPNWPTLTIDFLTQCLRLDPIYRPTSTELLKHTYFLHDRFPERFLPELRSRIHQEFMSNPLLRKQQQQQQQMVVQSRLRDTQQDNKSIQPRKMSITDSSQRWRINTSENIAGGDNRKLIIESGRASRRKLSDGMEVVEDDVDVQYKNMQARLGMTRELMWDVDARSPSPAPFQSLQVPVFGQTQSDSHLFSNNNHTNQPAHHQVLHPSINNLSFMNNNNNLVRLSDASKKSPLPLRPPRESMTNRPVLPSNTNIPRTQLVRRLDRGVLLDVSQMGTETRRRTSKPDDFSLPNVPGASGSPNKGKKKLNPVNTHTNGSDMSFISPRDNSSQSPSDSPKLKYSSNLPFV